MALEFALAGGAAYGADVASIAATLLESTVQVKSGKHGGGSGVVWGSDGVVVTNSHVVSGDTATVELVDGRTFDAHVTARDATRDLAKLSVQSFDLRPAAVRSSESLRVGEIVLALGAPLGIPNALTTGIVHAVGRTRRVVSGRFGPSRRTRWIHADIRLLPGNSGGPLADARGRVVGLNTMIAGGLALAVPSLDVERFVRDGSPRAWLGVEIQYVPAVVKGRRALGLYITSVAPGSPAARAKLAAGDVIVGDGSQLFESGLDAAEALRAGGERGGLLLEVIRGSRLVTIAVRTVAEAA